MTKVLAEVPISNNGVIQIVYDTNRDDELYLRVLRTGESFGINIPVNNEILHELYKLLKLFYGGFEGPIYKNLRPSFRKFAEATILNVEGEPND